MAKGKWQTDDELTEEFADVISKIIAEPELTEDEKAEWRALCKFAAFGYLCWLIAIPLWGYILENW